MFFFSSSDNRLQQLREREELKYSAEEKIVEDSESEDDDQLAKRSVAERREQIQKRLSIERQIPASTQKREIVQEITEIKRQSLIEDKKAMHEEEIIMRAPTDNIIKSASIPEPVIKLKSTKKDGGSDVSKTEFDKELQDKFRTTVKVVDHAAPIVREEQTDRSIDTKIEYDSTVTEKEFKDLEDEIVKKSETIITAQIVVDKSAATARFVEQERHEQSKLIKRPLSKETSDDIIDPQLAAKLTAQKEKIVDFVEMEREILSPVKCEIKKTISSDQIDAELSSKLSKQKEKAERIVEDAMDEDLMKDFQTEKMIKVDADIKGAAKQPKVATTTTTTTITTSELVSMDSHRIETTAQLLQGNKVEAQKVIQDTKKTEVLDAKDEAKIVPTISEPLKQTEKPETVSSKSDGTDIVSHQATESRVTITKTQQFIREESVEADKLTQTKKQPAASDKAAEKKSMPDETHKPTEKHVIASTVSFLQDAQQEAHKLHQASLVKKTEATKEEQSGTPVKHSTDLFTSEMESDEFYKSIEAKITKKLSKDSSAMQDDIASAGK